MDRALLADFLRARREALQPEDVGLPRGGTRRRASGLRREEVAVLAGMSADYYSRIEQQRGPMPSEQVLAALAQGLKLSPSEREHLFALGGHSAPRRALRDERVSPAMQRIVERLADTPAIVFSQFGEALLQTRGAVALFGDYTSFSGMSRYLVYRWYTDPAQRAIYPPEDHDLRGRVFTVDLRAVYTADPAGTAGEIVEALLAVSPEFAEVWRRHEVDVTHHYELKRYVHPELGDLEMHSWRLMDPDESQDLLVFMAEPGSPSEERLQRLGDLPR